ncbi:hypothetical protein NX059_008126 [Plenodomus lindquistii]|nr:hypothetical protein NX059_008126 [Plenodomus lindquistii]
MSASCLIDPDDTPSCHCPLDNSTSSILSLPDGRKLGYAQYGAPTGKPIFFFHGLPGSRLEGAYFDELGKELGARIISPDRPGMGWSTPQPGRSLLDWPKDVEALAKELGLQEYSVMGASGGGPYALSCAYSLPTSRLKTLTLICGLGPPNLSMRGADLAHRIGIPHAWRWAPTSLIRWFLALDPLFRTSVPESTRLELKMRPREQAKITHEKDRRIYAGRHVVRMMLRCVSEALGQGLRVAREDGRVVCGEWGFRVEDVGKKGVKAVLWYGREDVFVPIGHGEGIAERLESGGGEGRLERRFFEDDTHSSIFFGRRREILERILKEM